MQFTGASGGGALPAKGVGIVDVVTPNPGYSLHAHIGELITNKKSTLADLHPQNPKLVEVIEKSFPKFLQKTRIGKVLMEAVISSVEGAQNAFYSPNAKRVILNSNEFGISAFHEMGHAINHNCSKFWKVMQKMRTPMGLLGTTAATVALFKRKKVEGEEPKNAFDKATTFVKNNVGKIVTLSFVPIIAEELKATQRGNKLAAKVLSKDMLKKVKKGNALGAATYVSAAIFSGAGAFLASKIRDKIAKPKEV